MPFPLPGTLHSPLVPPEKPGFHKPYPKCQTIWLSTKKYERYNSPKSADLKLCLPLQGKTSPAKPFCTQEEHRDWSPGHLCPLIHSFIHSFPECHPSASAGSGASSPVSTVTRLLTLKTRARWRARPRVPVGTMSQVSGEGTG